MLLIRFFSFLRCFVLKNCFLINYQVIEKEGNRPSEHRQRRNRLTREKNKRKALGLVIHVGHVNRFHH